MDFSTCSNAFCSFYKYLKFFTSYPIFLPELKEILHTEFVKYFERKSQKPRRKRQRKNKLCADYIYKDT